MGHLPEGLCHGIHVAQPWNSTIGNRSDIENVGIDNLRAFYRTYYQPDNAVLLVAGKIDSAKTLAWIADHFGKVPRPTRKLPKLWTVEPTQDGEREVTVRRVGDSQILFPAYRVPAAAHPDAPAIQVLMALMTAEPLDACTRRWSNQVCGVGRQRK